MLVFVALTGKSLEVDVQQSTRVSQILETLATVAGIGPADQIMLCEGTRLDPLKPLSAYGLPDTASPGIRDVFLYNKSNLRLKGQALPVEPFRPLTSPGPPAEAQELLHALDAASSPLVRALPQYERSFDWHLKIGRAGAEALAQRDRDCLALISEMEVQSRAIDSARTSVETHYTYIHGQITAFIQRYSVQRAAHQEVLSGFERELSSLEGASLHPAMQSEAHRTLLDLVDAPRLRDWAGRCLACHQSLVQKVASLEELFAALKADVEAVFMQGPSVQLEARATQLQAMRPHVEGLASIVQVLDRDNTQIQRLMHTAQQELSSGSRPGRSITPLDTCQLMETMHENHTAHLVPQVEHYRDIFEHFYKRCIDDKNQMTRDVAAQLQSISGQQMKIQSLRNKLAVFREAASKEDEMYAQLLLVRQIPIAYRQCLAECMRRQAFGELYAGQAGQVAERMGKLREKEQEVREAFLRQVQVYIPQPLLDRLGLLEPPAHCQISLPPQTKLPPVALADLQATPRLTSPAASAARLLPFGGAQPPAQVSTAPAAAEPGPEGGELAGEQSLTVENAKLRSELATRIADECLRSLAEPQTPAQSAGPEASDLQGSSQNSGQQSAEDARQAKLKSPEAAKFKAAIGAQREHVQHLETQLARSREQCAAYEARIHSLESRLAQQAAASSRARSPPPASSDNDLPMSAQGGRSRQSVGRLAPLALTPVLASPTRSISPALPAIPDLAARSPGQRTSLHASAMGDVRAAGDPLLEAISSRFRVAQPAPDSVADIADDDRGQTGSESSGVQPRTPDAGGDVVSISMTMDADAGQVRVSAVARSPAVPSLLAYASRGGQSQS